MLFAYSICVFNGTLTGHLTREHFHCLSRVETVIWIDDHLRLNSTKFGGN